MEQAEILDIFAKTEGILHGHFQLASGRHSDTYMQCAKLFMHPAESRVICKALAEKLQGLPIQMVASPAVGGVIMGYEMAAQLGVPNVFFERIDGSMTLRRGFSIPKGCNVLIVEDVVTTGGSVFEVIGQVEALGGRVVAVASVVDRSNGAVDFHKPFYPLLSLEVKSYPPEECALCRQGVPVTKPGTKALQV